MSFTNDVKKDILTYEYNDEELKAELYGILKLKLELIIRFDGISAEIKTASLNISRRLIYLVKKIYKINIELKAKARAKLDHNNIYYVTINDSVQDMLIDLQLVDEYFNYIDEVPSIYDGYESSVIRGFFLAKGSINEPSKARYHLEISCKSDSEVDFIINALNKIDINGKKANRHLLKKNITDNTLDAETKVGSISQDNRSYQTGYEKDNGEKHETSNYYIQKVRIANEDYFANVFPDKQLIKTTNYGVIDETNTEEKHFSNATFMLVITAIDYFETREFLQQLSTLSEADLANYKFYKNNNTYTSVYTYNITDVTDPMKTTNTSTATTEKIQFTFTDYGFDYLASFNQDAKVKYLKDNGDSFKKGDYTNTKHIGYIECKYEDSPTNLNLEPIDYTDFDAEVDIEY